MSKKKLFFILIGSLFLIVLIWRIQSTIRDKKQLAAMQNPVVYPRVEVAVPVEREIDDFLSLWGEIESKERVEVFSKFSGILTKINFDVGDFVKINDTLAIFDRNLQPLDYQSVSVLSPMKGIVSKKYENVGSTVSPQSALFRIETINQLLVRSYVNQKDIQKVKPNQRVQIECNAFEGEVFLGSISKIYPSFENTNRSIPIEISIPSGKLKPGMYVHVSIQIQKIKGLFLPVEAIYERDREVKVGVLKSPIVSIQKISAGKRFGNERLVEGLSKEDTVITSGLDWLSNGDTVVVYKGANL